MNTYQLEQMLHSEMPLVAAMGAKVVECSTGRVIITAPLAANYNHLRTAFGGSLNALATLAGYGLIWALVDDPKAHVVIRESTIRFDRPVRCDLRAVCLAPGESEVARFRDQLQCNSKARLSLHVEIEEGGVAAVKFDGVFVALR